MFNSRLYHPHHPHDPHHPHHRRHGAPTHEAPNKSCYSRAIPINMRPDERRERRETNYLNQTVNLGTE